MGKVFFNSVPKIGFLQKGNQNYYQGRENRRRAKENMARKRQVSLCDAFRSQQASISIAVVFLSGTSMQVTVRYDDTWDRVKHSIYIEKGVPPSNQNLLHGTLSLDAGNAYQWLLGLMSEHDKTVEISLVVCHSSISIISEVDREECIHSFASSEVSIQKLRKRLGVDTSVLLILFSREHNVWWFEKVATRITASDRAARKAVAALTSSSPDTCDKGNQWYAGNVRKQMQRHATFHFSKSFRSGCFDKEPLNFELLQFASLNAIVSRALLDLPFQY